MTTLASRARYLRSLERSILWVWFSFLAVQVAALVVVPLSISP